MGKPKVADGGVARCLELSEQVTDTRRKRLEQLLAAGAEDVREQLRGAQLDAEGEHVDVPVPQALHERVPALDLCVPRSLRRDCLPGALLRDSGILGAPG